MDQTLVSIIIPCYNHAEYLQEALESVLKQTYRNWECIIVNDGSTDHTEAVAKSWVEKDNRFKYLFQVNTGLGAARNTGLKVAKGEYIQFLDSDDLIKPDKFELQIQDLVNSEVSISDYIAFQDGTGSIVKNRYLSPFLSDSDFTKDIILNWETFTSIPCHTILFKMDLVRKHKIYFEPTLPNHEDWVFWVKLFYFSTRIKNNKNTLAFYRIRNNSMCTDYKKMNTGFIKACDLLLFFFNEQQSRRFKKYIKIKRKEILNRNSKNESKLYNIKKILKKILKNLRE